MWAGDTGQSSKLTQSEHGHRLLISHRPFLSTDSYRNPAERVTQITLHSCYNCVTSIASSLNVFFPNDLEDTMSLVHKISSYGREKDTSFVVGCKKKNQKRDRWNFLSFKFQKALNSSEDDESSDSWSPLCHLLSPVMITTPPSSFHPSLPPSTSSTPIQGTELWMLCNKWVQLGFVEYSSADLKKCHPWKVLPTNGQIAEVFSVLNFFLTVWLVLCYPNRKTTLPKAFSCCKPQPPK